MRANRWLVFFGLLTVVWGTAWGANLGRNEHAMQEQARAQVVAHAAAHNLPAGVAADDPGVEKVVSKYWARIKRVHLHAEGIGTLSIALGLVAGLLTLPVWAQTLLGVGTGLAGFLYPMGWLVAANATPSLGSGAAKEVAERLFVPGGLGFLLGAGVFLALFAYQSLFKRSPDAP